MLDYIRNSAQSFGVKVAFGIIILVFVFWGIGNFNDRDYSNVVAVVNGEPIVATEFERAYHNAEEYILRQNPSMTREQLVKDHLGRQVLRDMIQLALIGQEARRAGISVTPGELRAAVAQNRVFQDENGKFDPDAYQRVLAAQRISPARFEHDLDQQLTRDKIFGLVTASVWVDPDEARHRYDFLRERREVDYRFFPASAFTKQVEVTEKEARNWYDSHQSEFAIPPMVDVAYIDIRPEALVKPESINEEAARLWYEANQSRFETPEQVRAAHILVEVSPDASEADQKKANDAIAKAKADLASGKSFAEIANTINSENAADRNGELGWIKRGQTVPEFEEAAFALPPGEVSGPVRTPFGLHIIKVLEKKDAGVPPFKDVEAEARKALAAEEGADKIHDVLDNLIEDNILQKNLPESAAKYGLKAEESGLLDKKGLMDRLGVTAEGADALLATPSGSPLDTALEAGEKYIVARVIKSEPAGTKPFEEIKEGLINDLKAEKAESRALAEATTALEKAKTAAFNEAEAKRLELKTAPDVERGGTFADFEPDPALNQAIFSTKPGEWLAKAWQVRGPEGQGAIMARVAKTVPAPAGEFDSVADIMANAVKQERMDAVYGLMLQNLANGAKVEITNPGLVDRANM